MTRAFKITVDGISVWKTGISGSMGDACKRGTGSSCLGASASSACSVGRFAAGGRLGDGLGWVSSPAVGRGSSAVGLFMGGSSLSKMCHAGVALGGYVKHNLYLGKASYN